MHSEQSAERSYIAFISYRHLPLDREAAVRIQKKIENYVVPKEFRDRTGGSKKLGVCFRDEDELPASSSLSDSITYALDHTQYLIVVCTPDLPKSKWCLEEVRYFLQTHDRDHVLAVLADGSPKESFPEQLRFTYDEEGRELAEVEPLAANIAGEDHTINNKTFKKEVTRLIAAMLGCPFDALWQRERRARTNRLLAAAGVVFAAMAVFIGVVLSKNAQISEQNQTITAKNRELEQKMSSALVDAGLAQLQNYDRKGAIKSALDALESGDPAIYDHRAEQLLTDALGAYQYKTPQFDLLMTQTTNIERIAVTEDGSAALITDRVGNIRAVSIRDGSVYWEVFLNTSEAPYLYPVGNDILLCKSPETLTALSVSDGSLLWAYENNLANPFQGISDDGALFAVLDSVMSRYEYYSLYGSSDQKTVDMVIHILDTATGEIRSTLSLPDDPYHIYIGTSTEIYEYSCDFSDDNSYLAAVLPTDREEGPKTLVFSGALASGKVSCIGTYASSPDMILGIEYSADHQSAYLAVTDNKTLYSVIMYADPKKDSDVTEIDYSMSSPMGVDSFDYRTAERPYIPMLTSKNLVLLFSKNEVYVINRSDGTKRFSLDLDSPIVTALWQDRDKEILEILTQSGALNSYDFGYNADLLLNGYGVHQVPLDNITSACRYYDGSKSEYNDLILAVSSAQPGHLLLVSPSSDPGYTPVASHEKSCAFAVLTPSGERMMYFYTIADDTYSTYVETVDLRTGEVCESATVSLSPVFLPLLGVSSRPLAIDDSHFLIFGAIFGLDGSVVHVDGSTGYRIEFWSSVQEDGSLLYGHEAFLTIPDNDKYNPIALACYLDGTLEEESKTVEGGLVFALEQGDDRDHFALSRFGWIAGWGNDLTMDGSVLTASEKTKVVVQNVRTREKYEIEDDCTGIPVTHMIFANKSAKLACAYENGAVAVYDPETKGSRLLPSDYASGEIQDLCFSDTDGRLLVLTVNGRVDCYRLDTDEQEASLPQCFAASDSSLINRFTAVEDAESCRLILTAANESGDNDPIDLNKAKYWTTVIDTSSWEIAAQPDNVCFWSVKYGQAMIANGKESGVCKIHTLKDLAEWARSELAK